MPRPLPRLTLTATAVASLISIAVAIAGHGHTTVSAADEVAPADTAAWNLGCEHAAAMVAECGDDSSRALRLLDVRARESNLRARIGDAAADAYVKGFEYGLRQNSDSLARVILK